MNDTKINIRDDITTIITKLSDGNPGAVACLIELVNQQTPLIFGYGVAMFQALHLRGERIYILWNDCLDRRISYLSGLIEDWWDGRIKSTTIIEHVNGDGCRGLPF